MIPKNTLDPNTKKTLEDLLNKSAKDLTPDDIAFLHARSAYLTDREISSIPEIQEAVIVKKKAKRKYL